MYVADPNLIMPSDETLLWRYQTFDRFVQFLDSGTLWFSRADRFVDRFEIAVPTADLETAHAGMLATVREWGAQDNVRRWLERFAGLSTEALAALPDEELAALMPRFANRFNYVSSWHRNDTESAGLWAQYTGTGNGVAVRTDVGTLRDELNSGSGDKTLVLGAVEYLNYHTESWGTWHQNSAVFHKRTSYAYEQEVRAVIGWPNYAQFTNGSVDPVSMPDVEGLAIPVDRGRLVHSVVISPDANAWFPELVTSVMRRYGLTATPIFSELTKEPDW
jgi:hypothetical protein